MELRQLLEPEPAARRGCRPVGEHEQHGQRGRRADEGREQVARERADPVTVLEHDHDELARPHGPCRQSASRPSSDVLRSLASNERGEVVVGDRDAEQRAEQRCALHERRVDLLERALDCEPLLVVGSRLVDAEEAAPDLLPDEVVRVRAERRALAEGDEAAAGADGADELRDEARLAERPPRPRCRRRSLAARACARAPPRVP